jgi:hypothetical protein
MKASVVNFSRLSMLMYAMTMMKMYGWQSVTHLVLVTEAATYEELTERVISGTELYELNGFGGNPHRISLSFNRSESYSDRIAL